MKALMRCAGAAYRAIAAITTTSRAMHLRFFVSDKGQANITKFVFFCFHNAIVFDRKYCIKGGGRKEKVTSTEQDSSLCRFGNQVTALPTIEINIFCRLSVSHFLAYNSASFTLHPLYHPGIEEKNMGKVKVSCTACSCGKLKLKPPTTSSNHRHYLHYYQFKVVLILLRCIGCMLKATN